MNAEEIQTPALVLNLDGLERNLRRMADECRSLGVALRPHTKTHKSPWVARRQLELGAAGVCAAKIGEAEVLVRSGIDNVLITTEPAPNKAGRVADLARLARISAVADSLDGVQALASAARAAGVVIDVLLDLNVGQNRTGTEPGAQALLVAAAIAEAGGLRLAGIQAYEGHSQHVFDLEERRTAAFASYECLAATRLALEDAGLDVPWLTTAGTGTFRLAAEHGVATEVQPGSYAVMDSVYAQVQPPLFENALWVVAGVVSTNREGYAVVDAGWKTVSIDGGMPAVKDRAGCAYSVAGDEHGKVSGLGSVRLGDQVWLVPSHCDTTINLFDRYVLVDDGGQVVGELPVATRGKSA